MYKDYFVSVCLLTGCFIHWHLKNEKVQLSMEDGRKEYEGEKGREGEIKREEKEEGRVRSRM